MTADDKLALDAQLMEIYLTGLQAEIEAKLRRVAKFRDEMQKIDPAGRKSERAARQRAARTLFGQVEEMLQTNLAVREMLIELRTAVEAVLRDLER